MTFNGLFYVLILAGKPKVSVGDNVVNCKIGELIILSCKIKSLPTMSMNWKMNGTEVSNIPAIKKRMELDLAVQSETEITFILKIRNLKKRDFGTYECIAYNKYGNSTDEITLLRKYCYYIIT